jgi:hypothetical protein
MDYGSAVRRAAQSLRPSRTPVVCATLAAVSVLTEPDALYLVHRRCGEPDAGVEEPMVWMACDCGASMARRVSEVPASGRGRVQPMNYGPVAVVAILVGVVVVAVFVGAAIDMVCRDLFDMGRDRRRRRRRRRDREDSTWDRY